MCVPEGFSLVASCDSTYQLWMLYCEKAIINCDNYGGAITFDIAISGEKKETIAEKRRR